MSRTDGTPSCVRRLFQRQSAPQPRDDHLALLTRQRIQNGNCFAGIDSVDRSFFEPTLALGEDLIIQKGWLWTVSNASVNGMSLTSTSTKAFAPYSPFVGLNSGSMWSLPGVNGLALRWNNTSKVVKITALRLATAIYHSLGKARSTGSPNDGATCTSQTTPGPDTAPVLKVVGNPTSGLFPGSSQSIDLSLINSYPTPLTAYARSIVLTLTSPNPSCSIAGNFVVNQSLTATVVAPGNATWSLSDLNIPIGKWPKISMLETGINQDACRGVVLTMHYTWRYAG